MAVLKKLTIVTAGVALIALETVSTTAPALALKFDYQGSSYAMSGSFDIDDSWLNNFLSSGLGSQVLGPESGIFDAITNFNFTTGDISYTEDQALFFGAESAFLWMLPSASWTIQFSWSGSEWTGMWTYYNYFSDEYEPPIEDVLLVTTAPSIVDQPVEPTPTPPPVIPTPEPTPSPGDTPATAVPEPTSVVALLLMSGVFIRKHWAWSTLLGRR